VSGPLPRLTARQLIRLLERDGWFVVRQRGSHVFLQHDGKPGTLSVPFHAGRTIGVGLLRAIVRQAGLTIEEFRELNR
jgi:predicted RNA binding protein YcfA (HicA-like mRNA interferase family)